MLDSKQMADAVYDLKQDGVVYLPTLLDTIQMFSDIQFLYVTLRQGHLKLSRADTGYKIEVIYE